MEVKKYYIDLFNYNIEDNDIYGDMGYTICDMPETLCHTLEEAKKCVYDAIECEIEENGEFDEIIPIYAIVEYTFDSDKVEDDDYTLFNNDAIIEYETIYAECPCGILFDKVNSVWKERYDFDIVNHIISYNN